MGLEGVVDHVHFFKGGLWAPREEWSDLSSVEQTLLETEGRFDACELEDGRFVVWSAEKEEIVGSGTTFGWACCIARLLSMAAAGCAPGAGTTEMYRMIDETKTRMRARARVREWMKIRWE
jgi:hypothetical protein